MRELIDKLAETRRLDAEEFARLAGGADEKVRAHAAAKARAAADRVFGKTVYLRGLIEFTNYCRNDCLYCGIRRGNSHAARYRLTREEILECADEGANLGFRTFVLQGGEDPACDDRRLVDIVSSLRAAHPDCAITLSVGERSRESYQALRRAGVDRYLLRHETADPEHYARLHPASLSLENRKRCLWELKALGFQAGCGFMVGSPWQTPENIAADLLFVREFDPHMVGLGPFIPHRDTPFASFPAGDVETTLLLLSLVRLMLPEVLLPATTALGTLDPFGRERGILAGANVLMPNLSPKSVRDKYLLYDNKLHTGVEAAEHVQELAERLASIGFTLDDTRGDHPGVV